MERMSTILITGGNRGLGHEAARRLLAAGHDVWIGARDPERGRAAAEALGARFVALDVTEDASVAAAAETVGELDVLINNAGISGGRVPVPDVQPADVARVFETNVYGIVRVTHAFLPALQRSENPVIVNVSSGMGSFAITGDPGRVESTIVGLAYPASKSAVTMLTTQYAKAFPQMRVNAVDPGYTATDFNRHSGPQTVAEGTDAIVAMATIGPDGPTGTFTDRHGAVPW
jgi:NAD(P)-dependent dehydrogenase (short-subunit alcohol dehydrogenase family)